jgi:hypothetical protein
MHAPSCETPGTRHDQALHAVAALGVADALAGGPQSAPDLAQAAGVHEPPLRRVRSRTGRFMPRWAVRAMADGSRPSTAGLGGYAA